MLSLGIFFTSTALMKFWLKESWEELFKVVDQTITLKPLKRDLKPSKTRQFLSLKTSKAKVTASRLMLPKANNRYTKN